MCGDIPATRKTEVVKHWLSINTTYNVELATWCRESYYKDSTTTSVSDSDAARRWDCRVPCEGEQMLSRIAVTGIWYSWTDKQSNATPELYNPSTLWGWSLVGINWPTNMIVVTVRHLFDATGNTHPSTRMGMAMLFFWIDTMCSVIVTVISLHIFIWREVHHTDLDTTINVVPWVDSLHKVIYG